MKRGEMPYILITKLTIMKPKEFNNWKGHIILYCKNHYKIINGFIEGLRMVWAIRCGYNYKDSDKSVDRYIANELYSILIELIPDELIRIQERIHEEINITWRYDTSDSLKRLILIYASEIANIQVKTKQKKRYKSIVKLPKPKKRVFNRILRGNGKYEDYKLINN